MSDLTVSNSKNFAISPEQIPSLHQAFEQPNNTAAIRSLFEASSRELRAYLLTEQDEKGRTVLFRAAAKGNIAVVELLLEYGAPTEIEDKEGNIPLFKAVEREDIRMISLFFKRISFCRHQNRVGKTVLHKAVEGGNIRIIEEMTGRTTSLLNIRDINGKTPLHYAAARGNVAAMGYFLRCRPSLWGALWELDNNYMTPLHHAALNGHVAAAEYILERNPQLINTRDSQGRSPLLCAGYAGSQALAQTLIDKGADIHISTNGLQNIFHIAATKNWIEIMERCLNEEMSVDLEEGLKRRTPLALAVEYNQIDSARYLLNHGADMSRRDMSGKTPLILAAERGQSSMVKLFLERGVSIDETDYLGRTACDIARSNYHLDVLKLLQEHARKSKS